MAPFQISLVIFSVLVLSTSSARILFFCGLSTYSHRLLVWPLVEELTSRGHQVTYFSSSPNREPNPQGVEDFVPSSLTEFYKGEGVMNINLLHTRLEGKLKEKWDEMPQFGIELCRQILNSPDTKEWADRSHFDLIFIDAIFNDCGFALVHKYKAKHILLGTTTIFTWNYDPLGIVPETSWIPDFVHHFPGAENITFISRVFSTLENIRWYFVRQNYYLPKIEEIIRNDFGLEDLPSISQLEQNVSLYFTNTHFSEEYARAVPPFVIPIGGIHLQKNHTSQTIPLNLQHFINSGRNGGDFIYISFGSDTLISTLPKPRLLSIFRALEKTGLPCIWRWDGEIPEDVPKNLLLSKWIPQQAVLSHPKIKIMITHGGLLSIHEAIHHKVPMLVIPIFAEQDFNAERVHRKGFGIKLNINTLTQDQLESGISALLHDPRYRSRINKISSVFEDRMNSPLETAVWYTEYVLRHDTSLMKPHSLYQTWYQRRLLDVWAFVFSIAMSVLLVIFFILKFTFTFITSFVAGSMPVQAAKIKKK